MIIRTLIATLLLTVSACSYAEEFDICKDIVIDQVTEMAFGEQGVPYTGKVTCYRDVEKTILKYTRAFDNGKPIGRHICYSNNGKPTSSISFDNSNTRKRGMELSGWNGKFGARKCAEDNIGACWTDRVCESHHDCTFQCK